MPRDFLDIAEFIWKLSLGQKNTGTRLSQGLLWWVVCTCVHMHVCVFFQNKQKQQGGGGELNEQ